MPPEEIARIIEAINTARLEAEAAIRNIRSTQKNLEIAERSARYAEAAARRADLAARAGRFDALSTEIQNMTAGLQRMADEMGIAFVRSEVIPRIEPKAPVTVAPGTRMIEFEFAYSTREGGPVSETTVTAPDYGVAVNELLGKEPRAIHVRPRRYRIKPGAWRRADWLPGVVRI